MSGRPVTEYHAIDELMEGDVIRFNGRIRKVRALTRTPKDDAVRSVTFAILRPSWTDRPYTVYTRYELKVGFGGIVAKGVSLCTVDIECRVQREIEDDKRRRSVAPPRITAREMAGLVA